MEVLVEEASRSSSIAKNASDMAEHLIGIFRIQSRAEVQR